MNLLSVFMQEFGKLDLTQIGVTNSVFGLFVMLTTIPAGPTGRQSGRAGDNRAGRFLLIGFSIGGLVMLPPAVFWMYAAGLALAGIGVGLITPAYQLLISKAVPRHLRGTAFGLFSTSLGLISLPAPWLGAQLWQQVGPRFPFLITATVSILSIIPIWLKFKLPEETS